MQRFSHSDVFLCPDFNLGPAVSDPKTYLCGAEDTFNPYLFTDLDNPTGSRAGSPSSTGTLYSPFVRRSSPIPSASQTDFRRAQVSEPPSPPPSPSSSREASRSPASSRPASPSSQTSTDSEGSRKLRKYRSMSSRGGMSLLDIAVEMDRRRIANDKRRQVRLSPPPPPNPAPDLRISRARADATRLPS